MSSASKPGTKDPLPQDESLGAFAAAAFGPRKRRPRRDSDQDGGRPAGEKPAETPATDTSEERAASAREAEPVAEAPPVVEQPTVEPATAEPEPSETPAAAGQQREEAPQESAAPAAPVVEERAEPAVPPQTTPEPAPAPGREVAVHRPTPVAVVRRRPAPARRRDGTVQIQVPDLGPEADRATQCTIMVSASVRERFAHYQLAKKTEKGTEPTNAIVVRRAVLHARKQDLFPALLEAVRHRQQPVEEEDHDPDDLFGDVPGRRVERGRIKDSVQQSFRPSLRELAVIDAIVAAYGFPSRSDLLDAVLDAFLPPLP